ncbi:MAG: tetratricopeptide repeat protein [Pseudobdellovibrionaceae bacterium]|nr:MAG: tetratricopeptide repeat protein [Pseudobdellovibrionaceae bacterium]
MSKTKITKEELKGPDSFVMFSDRVIKMIEDHRKLVMSVLVAAFVLGASYVGYEQFEKHQEVVAKEALFKVENELAKKQESLAEKKDIAESKDSNGATKAEVVTEADSFAAEVEPLLQKFRQVIVDYKGTQSAVSAAFIAAEAYAENKNPKEAVESLKLVVNEVKPGHLTYGILQSKLATLSMDLGNYEHAIEHLDNVINKSQQKYLFADALLKKGICLEKLNKNTEALGVYSQVDEDYSETSAARTARTFRRLLLLRQNSSSSGGES